jgi:peptidoglycan/LPS O-acetylase OafA/YrhL
MQRPETERVYIIDLLRFIAAIGVVLYHLSYRMPTIDHMGGDPIQRSTGGLATATWALSCSS